MTEAEFNRLVFDLEQLRDGANVHTINKAINYLHSFYEGAWFLTDDEVRAKSLEGHANNCRLAVNRQDTSLLRYTMRRLF